MLNGLKIDNDGTVSDFVVENGKLLDGLYSAIGCNLVDVVRVTDRIDFWLDDEGLYTQEPNPYARALGQYLSQSAWIPIHGPVVLLGGTDDEGETRSLPVAIGARVRMLIAGARVLTS